jgi:membrane protease YdiL (CAAX protease family)
VIFALTGGVVMWGLRAEIAMAMVLFVGYRAARLRIVVRAPEIRELFLAGLVGLLSGGIAVGTFSMGVWRPVRRLVVPFGRPPTVVLWLALALLALANAAMEEFVWRGLLVGLLSKIGVAPALIGGLQAISFGLAHIRGIPGGVVGVMLTTGFALVQYRIVIRSRNIGGAIIAHWIADIAIFAYLAYNLVDFQGQGVLYG